MMSSVMSKAECKNSLNIFLNFYLAALYLLMLTQSLSSTSISLHLKLVLVSHGRTDGVEEKPFQVC